MSASKVGTRQSAAVDDLIRPSDTEHAINARDSNVEIFGENIGLVKVSEKEENQLSSVDNFTNDFKNNHYSNVAVDSLATTKLQKTDLSTNTSDFKPVAPNSSGNTFDYPAIDKDRERGQEFFNKGKPKLSQRANTRNNNNKLKTAGLSSTSESRIDYLKSVKTNQHEADILDVRRNVTRHESDKSNATYDLDTEGDKISIFSKKVISEKHDNHQTLTYYDKKFHYNAIQPNKPQRELRTVVTKNSLASKPKLSPISAKTDAEKASFERELSEFRAEYLRLRKLRRKGTSQRKASSARASAKGHSANAKVSTLHNLKKQDNFADNNGILIINKPSSKQTRKAHQQVALRGKSADFPERYKEKKFNLPPAHNGRNRSLIKQFETTERRRDQQIHFENQRDLSVRRSGFINSQSRDISKVTRSARTTVRFENPQIISDARAGNSSHSAPSTIRYKRMANPKFSASLYGPFYENRLQLAEDRYNVNRSYDANGGGVNVSTGAQPTASRTISNQNGTTITTTNNYNALPNNYVVETENWQPTNTTTTHARKSMDPKFAPSLYGPGYNNRDNSVDNRYATNGDRSLVSGSFNVTRQSNRSTSEPRASKNRSGTKTTTTNYYSQGPGITIGTNDNLDNNTLHVRKSLDPNSAPGLYGPYYKGRGQATNEEALRSTRKTHQNQLRSTSEQRTIATNNGGTNKTITYYNGYTAANINHNENFNENRTTRNLDPRFYPSLYGPYYKNRDSVTATARRRQMSEGTMLTQGYEVDPTAGVGVNGNTTTYYTVGEDGRHHDSAAATIKRILSAKDRKERTELSSRLYGPAYQRLERTRAERSLSPDGTYREGTSGRDQYSPRSSRSNSTVHRTVYNPGMRKEMRSPYASLLPGSHPHSHRQSFIVSGPSSNVRLPSITTTTNNRESSEGTFRYKRTLNSNSHAPSREHNDDSMSTPDVQPTPRLRRRVPVRNPAEEDAMFGETDAEMRAAALRRHAAASQDAWPMFKYERADGIACMVRTAPGKINEVRNHLRLMDGVEEDTQARIPPVPAMEFDADEQVELAPMQLVWAASPPPDVRPLYILMPVSSMPFNEMLQQFVFMYSVDYGDWHFAEGRLIQVPVNGAQKNFCEVVVPEAFQNIIFDVKMKYFENVRELGAEGGELYSTMEPGARVTVNKRTFDENAQIKIRVEPLDVNETDLQKLIPGADTSHVLAVSPVVKVTASQPTKRPIVVSLPKPGQTLFGSTALGLGTKLNDSRGQKVTLYTKDHQLSKYQPDASLQRENAGECDFNARIWKAGGSAYAFLVLTGLDAGQQPDGVVVNPDEAKDFLNRKLFDQMAGELDKDEMKVRALGRQLVNYNVTSDIFQGNEGGDLGGAVGQILRSWKNANKRTDESSMVRQLVGSLRETGFPADAATLQGRYRRYVRDTEEKKILAIFDELKSSPAVMVNWYSLGQELGLSDAFLKRVKDETTDLRKRCYAVLRAAYERLKNEEEFNREILFKYIVALRNIGCERIATNLGQRQLPKFYVASRDL